MHGAVPIRIPSPDQSSSIFVSNHDPRSIACGVFDKLDLISDSNSGTSLSIEFAHRDLGCMRWNMTLVSSYALVLVVV